MDKLLPLKLPPGMRNTGTVYQSKDRWYTGNFARFFQDTIQPIGGWAAITTSGATISNVPTVYNLVCTKPGKSITLISNVTVLGTLSFQGGSTNGIGLTGNLTLSNPGTAFFTGLSNSTTTGRALYLYPDFSNYNPNSVSGAVRRLPTPRSQH